MPSSGGRLATRVARAATRRGAFRTLLLDIDGTLAPIAPSPEQARVPRDTLAALRRLVGCGWTVAVISGRSASQARRLVPVRGTRVFGSHGLEGSWDPATHNGGVDPRTRRRLGALARDARRMAAGMTGAHIELKPAGIAFHDRRVPRGRLGAWRRRLRTWLAGEDLEGLEVIRGRRVVELRARGVHKGIVARALLRDRGARPRDDSLVAMGDDRTDEDLFREVGRRGLTVRVGRPGVRTVAIERLPSPAAVRRFLSTLADLSDDS